MRKLLLSVLLVSALALLGGTLAEARPVALSESARLVVPAPFDAPGAAMDGDSILVTANDQVGGRDAVSNFSGPVIG
jgi:hypothetical protein